MINENTSKINYFMGFGPLNAKYIFFAIEENAGIDNTIPNNERAEDIQIQNILINKSDNAPYSITTEELIDEMRLYSMDWLDRFKRNASKNKLYSCITEIYNHFNPERIISNFEIGYSHCDLLFGNFYPIGKNSTATSEYPEFMRDVYGVKDIIEYDEYFRRNREIIFSDFLQENILNSESEKYIFTFGYKQINYYEFFNKLFAKELREQAGQKIPEFKFGMTSRNKDNYYCVKIKNTHIFSFYHTGNGWLNIKQIRKLLGTI